MRSLDFVLDELVTANRVLAREEIVDSFGHISVRHPERPDRFFMSRARAPYCVEREDLIEFTLQGEPIDAGTRQPYLERFIHGAVLETRPDIHSVVHNHSANVVPFSATRTKLKPLLHMCASFGHEVPIWDSQTKFGDTSLLVSNLEMGRDLAKFLGEKGCAALMRGHGSVVLGTNIRHAVFIAVYLEMGAKLQMQAMGMGEITFLTAGEVDIIIGRTGPYTINRAWENWCRRAGREMGVEEEG